MSQTPEQEKNLNRYAEWLFGPEEEEPKDNKNKAQK